MSSEKVFFELYLSFRGGVAYVLISCVSLDCISICDNMCMFLLAYETNKYYNGI